MRATAQTSGARPRTILRVAATASLLFIVACATHVTGLYTDPRFDYASAVAKGFAVGGITSTLADKSGVDYGKSLPGIFKRELPLYTLVDSDEFARTIGTENQQRLLEEFRDTGSLSGQSSTLLSTGSGSSPYVFFVRLESDEVSRSRRSIERPIHWVEGRSLFTRVTTTRTTVRTVTASAVVFDSLDGVLVWRGTVSPAVSNTQSRTTHSYGYLVDYDWQYPDAPDLQHAVAAALRGFLEHFPQP